MIKIFDAFQIKGIDNCTIENQGISSIDLMERASLAVYEKLIRKLDLKYPVYVFAGSGNNGGDALAIARMLLVNHYNIYVFLVNPNNSLSPDCAINKERLEHLIPVHIIREGKDIPSITPNSIVIDSLFGSGLNRCVNGIHYEVIKAINSSECKVYSIDMPSGLFVEDNSDNNPNGIVHSDDVFTFQFPKLSLLLPESNKAYKKMNIVDIGLCERCIGELKTDYYYTEKKDIAELLRKRSLFSHKGDFGRAMIIAGSYGKMGAAVMAARACLRTGVGLLTMHIPACGIDVLQATVPESMADADESDKFVSNVRNDIEKYTLGIGPGIGTKAETKQLLYNIFEVYKKPLVLDADALNLISENEHLKKMIPPESILTPHPSEFERLAGAKFENGYNRLQAARQFAEEYGVYIVLKGAYSTIITPEKTVYFNSTGNPGMATGGSGDMLTGMITSLLAQKYDPLHAALLGVYLHGYAGDLAAKSKSEYALLPSDMIEYIGKAYRALEKVDF